MKKKQSPAEEILAKMCDGFNSSLAKSGYRWLNLEQFFNKFKYFYYCNGAFYFSKRKTKTTSEKVCLTAHYIKPDGEFVLGYTKISTYRRVLPFMEFKKNKVYDEWYTEWYTSKELYDLLPTRKKIIDELLSVL